MMALTVKLKALAFRERYRAVAGLYAHQVKGSVTVHIAAPAELVWDLAVPPSTPGGTSSSPPRTEPT
jgi:hypothetical protein